MGCLLQRPHYGDRCQLQFEVVFTETLRARQERTLELMVGIAVRRLADQKLLLQLRISPGLMCHASERDARSGDHSVRDFKTCRYRHQSECIGLPVP